MKRLMAFLLTVLLLTALASAAFTDADAIADGRRQAVSYVNEKGIISGFPDGTFRPADNLTRAQAAKILCTALIGADAANALTVTETGFSDVPDVHWAAKYVAYCAGKGIVAGVGGGRFDPDGALTAAAFSKMLLVAYGHAAADALVGAKWLTETQRIMREKQFDRGADAVENKPTSRENACQLAYNVLRAEETAQTPDGYRETTLSFTDAGSYRLLGRAVQTADGVVCDGCADGVEFTADCAGTIALTAGASAIETYNVTFRVIVDGAASGQLSFAKAGEKTETMVEGVAPGVHTIRIVKDYEPSQSTDVIKSVTLSCKPDTVKPTAQKDKLLLIIGDSDTAGVGTVKTNTPDKTTNSASAILSYGYRAAEMLGADYQILARRSMGILKQVGKPTAYNYAEMLEYQNRWRDGGAKYTFTRRPDAVVFKVSGNDKSFSAEEETAALEAFIAQLRGCVGADVPIVIFYTESTKHRPVAEAYLAAHPEVKGVSVLYNREGMGDHSTAEAHAGYAEKLAEVLRPILR